MNQDPKWHTVAALDDLPPGKMLQVTIDNHELLLANIGETILATDDLCTHEDASLSTGALHGDLVTCPLHGSRFCLRTGQPREEPAEEAIVCYQVRIKDENIQVNYVS